MNFLLPILFVLVSLNSFCQKKLEIYNFTYDIEDCGGNYEHGGRVSSYSIYADTLEIKFEVIYLSCHLFKKVSLKEYGDSMAIKFKKIEDQSCWCDGSAKYFFSIRCKKPTEEILKYSILEKRELVMHLENSDYEFKKLFPVKYLVLDSTRYNYVNKYGMKDGPWLESPDSSYWNYSKIIYYKNGKETFSIYPDSIRMPIKDSVITTFEGGKMISKIERIEGVDIITYYGSNTIDIFDPRFDKNGFDGVFLRKTSYSKGAKEECFMYIKDKRIVKKVCK